MKLRITLPLTLGLGLVCLLFSGAPAKAQNTCPAWNQLYSAVTSRSWDLNSVQGRRFLRRKLRQVRRCLITGGFAMGPGRLGPVRPGIPPHLYGYGWVGNCSGPYCGQWRAVRRPMRKVSSADGYLVCRRRHRRIKLGDDGSRTFYSCTPRPGVAPPAGRPTHLRGLGWIGQCSGPNCGQWNAVRRPIHRVSQARGQLICPPAYRRIPIGSGGGRTYFSCLLR